MKHEGLIASIRQRLINLSRENGEAFDFVLARYGVERFLYRLSVSGHADQFVLKGSMLFHVWNRRMHRPTRDLDLLGAGPADLESIRQSMIDVLRTDVTDDGLWFDESSLVVEPIREDMAYAGVRAKFRAKLGNVRIPVQVDVGFGDAVVPGPETREFPSLLTGLPGLSMRTYPACTVVGPQVAGGTGCEETRVRDALGSDSQPQGPCFTAISRQAAGRHPGVGERSEKESLQYDSVVPGQGCGVWSGGDREHRPDGSLVISLREPGRAAGHFPRMNIS